MRSLLSLVILIVFFSTNLVSAALMNSNWHIPLNHLEAYNENFVQEPVCKAVYEKRLKKIERNKKIQTGVGLGVGVTAGTLFTVYYMTEIGLLPWIVLLGWAGTAGAFVFAGAAGSGLVYLAINDWKKTEVVADYVLDKGINNSYMDLVELGHATYKAQYEENIAYTRTVLNKQRAAVGAPALSIEQVKAIYPMKQLTEKDRAQSVTDRAASRLLEKTLTNEAEFEEFRAVVQEMFASEVMCPKNKPIGVKATRKELKLRLNLIDSKS